MSHPLSPSSSDFHQEGKPPDFIQKGKIHIVRRQFQEAVKVCRLGLLANPTYVEGRLVLGMALMALARHDEVLAEMRVALELEPENPMAHVLKGEALYHKRDFEQAHEVLSYARALDPHNQKIDKLLDEIDDVINYGQEPGPRHKTETKVYPAQRAQVSAFSGDPSDVLSYAESFSEWDRLEQEDDEPTETDEMPAALASLRQSVPAPNDPDEDLQTDRSYIGFEDQDEEFTTAPFLPPTNMGHRMKLLEESEWTEPTVSESRESSVIVRPDDLTQEEAGVVDKVVVDEAQLVQSSRMEEPIIESRSGSSVSVRVGDDPISSYPEAPAEYPPRAVSEVFEEDPTLVPGQSMNDVPPPLAALGQVNLDPEPPTVIPGGSRSGPLQVAPSAAISVEALSVAEEEAAEDQETVVNADAPSPEALFGEESEVVWEPPRQVHDPTRALEMAREPDRFTAQLERDSDEYVMEQEGTHELTDSSGVSQADIYSGEFEEICASADRDPFEPAINASLPLPQEYEADLSELSVEMLPDDVEMPPLPDDVDGSNGMVEVSPVVHLPPMLEDDDDQHATRVNFDVPDVDSPYPQDDFGVAPYVPGGEAQRYPKSYEIQDEDELSMEQADELGQPKWPVRPGRTAALDEDEGRAYAYVVQESLARPGTSEIRPAGPQGIRDQPPMGNLSHVDPLNERMLEQMTGDSGLFLREARSEHGDRIRVVAPRQRQPDRTATSWLTILVGEPGSHRWIYLLLSAVGVLALAVAVGLAVRYYRLGEQIDAKRKQATVRLHAGNLLDFMSAAQSYADILARRSDDRQARAAHSRVQAAIPFEFGDPNPQTSVKEGQEENSAASADRVAAESYTRLYAGNLELAAKLMLRIHDGFPGNALVPYLAGRIALLEGNAASAVRDLEQAHKLDPKDTLALCALGHAQAAQGKHDAALVAFDKALTMNPDHVASLLGKAQVVIANRQGLNASPMDHELNTIVVGRRMKLASRGQRGWAYLLLARLYFNKGQLAQARHHISRARSNMPSQDVAFLDELAGVLIDASQLGEAEKIIRQSRTLMKGRPQPYYLMARIHLLHSRAQVALDELKQARGLQHAASNLLRAKIHLELGQLAEAEVEVDRALGMAEDLLDAHVVKAKVLAARNQGATAEEKLKALLRKHPDNSALLTAYGEILLRLGRLDDARTRFLEAIRLDRQAFDARLKLAEVFRTEGRFREASSSLAEAVRANPGNIMVLMKQAEIEFDMGDLAESATYFEEARRRSSNDPGSTLALARVHTLQHKFALAEKEINDAEAHGAAPDMLALARGRLAVKRWRAARAIGHLLTATKSRPGDVEAWTLMVQAHLDNNDPRSARQVLAEMLQRSPDSPEAVIVAARVDRTEGKASQAVRRVRPLVNQISRTTPPRSRADLLVQLGLSYQANGNLAEAAGQFDEAVRVCPQCPEAYYRKGMVQDERGQVEEAIVSLKAGLERDPLYADVYYDLAQILERAGQSAAAIEYYTKFRSCHPPKLLDEAARDAIEALHGKN